MTDVRDRGHRGAAVRWAGHVLTDWVTLRVYRRDAAEIDARRGSKTRAEFISDLLQKTVDGSEL